MSNDDGNNPTEEEGLPVQELAKLEQRITRLEESQTEAREERDALQDQLREAEQQRDDLITAIETVTGDLEEHARTLERINHRIDGSYEQIETLQENLEENIANIRSRVTTIEDNLNLEEWEAHSHVRGGSPLEHITQLPDSTKTEIKDPLRDAALVWEYFDEWSSSTPVGRTLKTGELLDRIETYYNHDKKYGYQQIYRIMRQFHNNSPSNYKYVNHSDKNRMLVKFSDVQQFEEDKSFELVNK